MMTLEQFTSNIEALIAAARDSGLLDDAIAAILCDAAEKLAEDLL
jgi:hypothetical protein